ncbi:MAG: hypothetical protein LBH32_09405 [Dysgonamonadaceae bacterium]|jgi:uncharacterized iron-regulated protein|nr:hypothetical protein [Dysgonamonadaceae bacterium]
MKVKNTFFYFLALLFSAGLFSCEDKNTSNNGDEDGYGYDFTNVINTYVDDVILNTYTEMKDDATALYESVEAYAEDRSQDKLNDVCNKWRAMRIPWEQSEGFLFGPAALLSLDPSLDSWPLDKKSIDLILNGQDAIDANRIASSNVHGFHAIEYIIFDGGKPKTASLNDRELAYLQAATDYLRNDTYQLYANWTGADNASEEVSEALEEAEIEIQYYFAGQFKNAGKAGSTFISQSDAIDQIIDGCIDIASEVGSQKIGGPYNTAKVDYEQAVLEVESWYSWNSLADYRNNIISIRNSYFGGRNKTAANASVNSISAFVKSKDAALDQEVTNAIEATVNAIDAITPPFRNAIQGGSNSKIDNAMDACANLEETLSKIKKLRN